MDTGHEFYLLCKSCNFKEIIPDLKSIKKNGRPLTKSPKWWCDGIEDQLMERMSANATERKKLVILKVG